VPLLNAARAEARTIFRKNASLQPNDPALAAAVKHAEEVSQILRQNVVQGKKMEGAAEDGSERYSE
jgi:complex III assembly factor LYRM7